MTDRPPPAFTPAFASYLDKANNTAAPVKPNFGLNKNVKPNFQLKCTKFDSNPGKLGDQIAKCDLNSKIVDSSLSEDKNLQPTSSENKPNASAFNLGTLKSYDQTNQKVTSSSFSNLINKHRETQQSSFESLTLGKLSEKYLNASHGTSPNFGSNSTSLDNPAIRCPVFEQSSCSPADTSNDITPLSKPAYASSKVVQIPLKERQNSISEVLSTSASSSDIGSPQTHSKFVFSPIPNKQQSHIGPASPNSRDSKLSSLSKLKDRAARSSIDTPRSFDIPSRTRFDSARSPSSSPRSTGALFAPDEDTDAAPACFTFDLSSALITSKQDRKGVGNENLTTKRRHEEHTIIVDQLNCIWDARNLLDSRSQLKRKRISSMGRVICKKWKTEDPELPIRFATRFQIPAFKFNTMSPDDEIQAKFKRRR